MNLLKSKSLYAALVAVFVVTGCSAPGPTTPGTSPSPSAGANGTTPAVTTEKASIAGTVTKDGTIPGKNASVVLILKTAGVDSDAKVSRTNQENGAFNFAGVGKGNYRVAFTLATEQERKDKARIFYNPKDGYTSDYYSFVTTRSFEYDGDQTKTYQVPTYNVGWKSNLSPYDESFKVLDDVKFSWSAAQGAKSYNVLIQDDNFNQVYKSAETTDTMWTWKASERTEALKAGRTYYFLVNVTFDTTGSPENSPVLTYGGSSLSKFTTK